MISHWSRAMDHLDIAKLHRRILLEFDQRRLIVRHEDHPLVPSLLNKPCNGLLHILVGSLRLQSNGLKSPRHPALQCQKWC